MDMTDFQDDLKQCKYVNLPSIVFGCVSNARVYGSLQQNGPQIPYGSLKDGDCIFVKTDFLALFLRDGVSRLPCRVRLITGHSDYTLPDVLGQAMFEYLANHPRIIHWYAANCRPGCHLKVTPIPIGLDYHTGATRSMFWYDFRLIRAPHQEAMMETIRARAKPWDQRKPVCYSNFHFATYDMFGNPRKRAMETLDPSLVFYEPAQINRQTTWENQSQYAFVLSPLGHGMDCHRTWEALLLGCIVVVETSPLDVLYEDLPVLVVKTWAAITRELLDETLVQFQRRTFDYEKLTNQYWIQKCRRGFVEKN